MLSSAPEGGPARFPFAIRRSRSGQLPDPRSARQKRYETGHVEPSSPIRAPPCRYSPWRGEFCPDPGAPVRWRTRPPSDASIFVAGTRTLSNRISQWPCWSWYPNIGKLRTISTPAVATGTKIIDCCLWGSASAFVFPMTTRISHRGSAAPVVHHFRPFTMYSSPSRTIDVMMFRASEDATSGSVMEKPERIVPSDQWLKPSLLLLAGSHQVQDLHVSGIRAPRS